MLKRLFHSISSRKPVTTSETTDASNQPNPSNHVEEKKEPVSVEQKQPRALIPLNELPMKTKIEKWIQTLNEPRMISTTDKETSTHKPLEIVCERNSFGHYDAFAYHFQAITLEKIESIPENMDAHVSSIQCHLLSGQHSRTPFLQVSWSPSVLETSLETIVSKERLVRRVSRVNKIQVPLMDKLIEIDYSKSELQDTDSIMGDVAFTEEEYLPADKIQVRHIVSLLYKLQGLQTPQILRCTLCAIHRNPLKFRIRCWGFQTLLDEQLRLIAQIFPDTVEQVWIDFTRRTLCVDVRSKKEIIETIWFRTGVYQTTFEQLTPSTLLVPPFSFASSSSSSALSDSDMDTTATSTTTTTTTGSGIGTGSGNAMTDWKNKTSIRGVKRNGTHLDSESLSSSSSSSSSTSSTSSLIGLNSLGSISMESEKDAYESELRTRTKRHKI